MRRHGWKLCMTCVLISGALAPAAVAQRKVDARLRYERCWAVLPIIGTGTLADPKRPMFAPLPGTGSPGSRTGILGYSFLPSDDGQFALVEFVAAQQSVFKDILAAPATLGPTVKTFLKGRDKLEDVEAEFKKHRKNFDFTHFGVRMP